MPTYTIPLPEPLSALLADELAKRVYYLAPGIEAFRLIGHGDLVTGLELDISRDAHVDAEGDAHVERLTGVVAEVVRTEVLPQRMLTIAPVWRSPHAESAVSGVFDALVAHGAVHAMGPGTVATGPLFTEVLDALDVLIRRIAVEQFGATPYRYPALLSTEALATGGYLAAFPQFVLSAGRLCSDFAGYREFADDVATGAGLAELFDQRSTHAGYCLPPTMCFHTYLQLAGRRLDGDPVAVTSRGKSFRFESRYSHGLERLWDFTIREIVFLGGAEAVARCREGFLDAACALVEDLGLAGSVLPASDPFFAAENAPHRALAQRLRGLKYELRLPAEDGRTVAAASFNVHGTTFGGPYAITAPDGGTAHTACVGFGLERLAFAVFCRYGVDRDAWPDRVRALLDL